MRLLKIIIFSLYCTFSRGLSLLREIGNHDARSDFSRLNRANPSRSHRVIFAIEQANLDMIESLLYEVSSPSSSKYRKFLSFEEVGNIVKNEVATNEVRQWLLRNNVSISESSLYGEYFQAEATVATWEKLLETEMFEFQNNRQSSKNHASVIRGLSYSIPEELNEHIFAIHGFTHLPAPLTHHSRLRNTSLEEGAFSLDTDSSYITPTNLRSIYRIVGSSSGIGSQAVFESLGQTYLDSDLAKFQADYGLQRHMISQVVGSPPSSASCYSDSNNCVEASLDVQYLMAIGDNVPTEYYYEPPSHMDAFISFASYLANTPNPSNVYSISYGSYELAYSRASLKTFNTEAMKAGLRGVTIVVSAGDDGIAGNLFRPYDYGGEGTSLDFCGYYASWPASSPYVTAVGATQNGLALTSSPEIACSSSSGAIITTGGGFSHYFPAPSFQEAAIASYFSKISPVQAEYDNEPYNRQNRGYPDVSMPGSDYIVRLAGNYCVVSGTSASAPVFAGMVALVNAHRISSGISNTGLGWLNPTIYANNGEIVSHDIISGNNSCTASSEACCTPLGFSATSGWDPVSGFGSIDYGKFLQYFSNGAL